MKNLTSLEGKGKLFYLYIHTLVLTLNKWKCQFKVQTWNLLMDSWRIFHSFSMLFFIFLLCVNSTTILTFSLPNFLFQNRSWILERFIVLFEWGQYRIGRKNGKVKKGEREREHFITISAMKRSTLYKKIVVV